MQDWQERVIIEHVELKEKIAKLHNFYSNPNNIKDLKNEDYDLLKNQLYVMLAYDEILVKRIARFKD